MYHTNVIYMDGDSTENRNKEELDPTEPKFSMFCVLSL